jgi:hypothetical protein
MHAMIDVESFGKKPGVAIRSIGATLFDPRGNGWGETFYANIDLQSCIDAGLRIEKETADWWDRQSQEAQAVLLTDTRPLHVVVATFKSWWFNHRCTKIWCQGAGFDAPLWQTACEIVGQEAPWNYYDILDTRTVYEICRFDQRKMAKVGTPHHALDDCKFQVMAVQTALRGMGQW